MLAALYVHLENRHDLFLIADECLKDDSSAPKTETIVEVNDQAWPDVSKMSSLPPLTCVTFPAEVFYDFARSWQEKTE